MRAEGRERQEKLRGRKIQGQNAQEGLKMARREEGGLGQKKKGEKRRKSAEGKKNETGGRRRCQGRQREGQKMERRAEDGEKVCGKRNQ